MNPGGMALTEAGARIITRKKKKKKKKKKGDPRKGGAYLSFSFSAKCRSLK
jgi:hypothetical protein